MRPRVNLLVVAVWLAAGVAPAPSAEAKTRSSHESKESAKRRKLLEELGLDKQDSAPSTTPVPDAVPANGAEKVEPAAPPASGAPADRTSGGDGKTPGSTTPTPSFRRAIHPLLMATCNVCHRTGGAAAATHFVLSGDATADHAVVVRLVDVRDPAASPLLVKVSGPPHAGGALWPAQSAPHARVLAWIAKGAKLDGGPGDSSPLAVPRVAAPLVSAPPSHRSEALAVAVTPSPSAPTPAVVEPATPLAAPAANDFASGVHPILMAACASCHRANAPAAMTRLVLTGVVAGDEAAARGLLDPAAPARSPLLTKSSGESHGGGAILPVGDPRHDVLLAWAKHAAQTPVASASVAGTAPAIAVATDVTPASAPPAPPASHAGVDLPLGFFLNGRFDLDYERRQFSGNPFGAQAVNALRSYHHFLFLSRESADDRCGVSVEILSLQFFDVHCRLTDRSRAVTVLLSGGKLVVPFGADPLYHQSYGGLAGFDQRMLPVIWAQEGVAAHVAFQRRGLALTDDLFLVRGYTLGRADAVLNLQNDFSPVDDARLGWGNRVGVSWMGVSAWYSTYFNTLGFGRHLFMQAFDLTVWRQRQLPVIGHFSLGAGALRADVAGGGDGVGGVGKDYYHFGSYFQIRYHPTDWLFAQYREGLRTFDNRRGVIVDNSRLTSADGSTHSFGVVARHGGVTGGVFYFINLEKVDEIPDDVFRVTVTYDF